VADIVISEFMDDSAVAELAASYRVLYDPALVDQPERLVEAVAPALAVIVRNRTQVRGGLLAAAPRLRAVGRLGVGLDNIDVPACRARGIAVLPATGANDVAVAEYVIAGLLMLWRGAYHATARVAGGAWPRQELIGGEAMGRTLGLVGLGNIAREVARRAAAFGMRLIAHDPMIAAADPAWREYGVEPRTLAEVLAEADAISLHVPFTEGTRNLIGRGAIAGMKPGSLLINSSRGGVVDERALADALRSGRLGGAMLDVFAAEPLGAANPYEGIKNLILTPHIAGVTDESNVRVSAVTAANVRRVLESAS
jgi:(S)-sulfolactate dehydrogenase